MGDSLQAYDEEIAFQRWYADHARRLGLNPNPDDPNHQYDYRAAHRAGIEPTWQEDHRQYRWDDRFSTNPDKAAGRIHDVPPLKKRMR